MGSALLVDAPAKINLSLHVLGRRADGYHELSGLVAFSRIADQLQFELSSEGNKTAEANPMLRLDVDGPFAGQLNEFSQNASDNLVLRAAQLFFEQAGISRSGAIRLHKNLPVAAGIGGGSSDAAATLVALQKLCSSPLSDEQLLQLALNLGADVPMCLAPGAQMIAGTGEICRPVTGFAALCAVLVNPRVCVATRDVFRELAAGDLAGGAPGMSINIPNLSSSTATIEWLRRQRNDLQVPAIRIAPVIAQVLREVTAGKDCLLARMSGSGATCFGLYGSEEDAEQSAVKISKDHPDWWVVATMLS